MKETFCCSMERETDRETETDREPRKTENIQQSRKAEWEPSAWMRKPEKASRSSCFRA